MTLEHKHDIGASLAAGGTLLLVGKLCPDQVITIEVTELTTKRIKWVESS
jgi:hypothetical protein